jgi:hypothetical protein
VHVVRPKAKALGYLEAFGWLDDFGLAISRDAMQTLLKLAVRAR